MIGKKNALYHPYKNVFGGILASMMLPTDHILGRNWKLFETKID